MNKTAFAPAIAEIEAEIGRLEGRIAGLRHVLALLGGGTQPEELPALPPPARKAARKARRLAAPQKGGGVWEINGHDISLGEQAYAAIELIAGAADCLPAERLLPIFDNVKQRWWSALNALNKKLKPAGAEIVHYRGEGYRLQNLEAGS